MKRVIAGLVLGAGLLLGATVAATSVAYAAGVFTLTSSAVKDDGILPQKFVGARALAEQQHEPPFIVASCVGQNISPPLAWHNPPPGTTSYALLMHDPEGRAPAGVEHMVIYGIPVSVTHFAEGALSKPSPEFVGGKDTMGVGIYFGPCTPPGTDWHHYTLTIVATDLDPKALPPGLTRAELTKALQGHVKGSAGLIVRWRHPR